MIELSSSYILMGGQSASPSPSSSSSPYCEEHKNTPTSTNEQFHWGNVLVSRHSSVKISSLFGFNINVSVNNEFIYRRTNSAASVTCTEYTGIQQTVLSSALTITMWWVTEIVRQRDPGHRTPNRKVLMAECRLLRWYHGTVKYQLLAERKSLMFDLGS